MICKFFAGLNLSTATDGHIPNEEGAASTTKIPLTESIAPTRSDENAETYSGKLQLQ